MSQADSANTTSPSRCARPAETFSTVERLNFQSAGATRKIQKFEIYNVDAGEVLGTYEAPSASAALDAMARDYGFADYNAVIAGYGVSREDAIGELQITVVS
jgi:hypothetical protein